MSGESPNTLSRDSVEQRMSRMQRQINQLLAIVQGQPIRAARISDVGGGNVTTGIMVVKDGVDGVILSVLNAANVEIARISKDGVQVVKGNVVINNTLGNAILDGLGIVSVNNFVHNTAVSLGNLRSTSATDFVDVPSTSLNLTLARQSVVEIQVSGNFSGVIADGETADIYAAIDIDGILYPDSVDGFGIVYSIADDAGGDVTNFAPSWHGFYIVTLPAGNHTIKMKYKKETGSVDAQVTNTMLSYLVLGK